MLPLRWFIWVSTCKIRNSWQDTGCQNSTTYRLLYIAWLYLVNVKFFQINLGTTGFLVPNLAPPFQFLGAHNTLQRQQICLLLTYGMILFFLGLSASAGHYGSNGTGRQFVITHNIQIRVGQVPNYDRAPNQTRSTTHPQRRWSQFKSLINYKS